VVERPPEQLRELKRAALATAGDFSIPRTADKALACYEALVSGSSADAGSDELRWEDVKTFMKTEWEILKSVARASDAALGTSLFSETEG